LKNPKWYLWITDVICAFFTISVTYTENYNCSHFVRVYNLA
jgi:hypothetical protein